MRLNLLGIKITEKDLEGAISGAPIRAAKEEELDEAVEQVEQELNSESLKRKMKK